MTCKYWIQEWALDSAKSPRISEGELAQLVTEGEWMLSGDLRFIDGIPMPPQDWLNENTDDMPW